MLILPLLVALPLIGAVILSFLPRDDHDDIRSASLVASVVTFIVSCVLYQRFDVSQGGFQFLFDVEWVPMVGAHIKMAVDGLSLLLIVLSSFLIPLTILASWNQVTTRVKDFHIALLTLQASMVAVFCARDVLMFYVVWEAMLIPMFLMIGVFGSEDRIKASLKFFIYTAAGSLMMLAAILYIYIHTPGAHSFDIEVMQATAAQMSKDKQYWLALAFGLAFAIKVPLFPLHTWLPHAHVQAPAAGSVQLAAVMLKMGGYGFLRFGLPFFPKGVLFWAPTVAWLAVIGVIYGACMALAQKDMKRLIAYSSVSHLALVVLGIFAFKKTAAVGACYQMLAHGLSTGGLFLLVGMLYERTHSRDMEDYGGLAASMPWLTFAFMVTTLASVAVPGTCGFVGEFMILLGTFEARPLWAGLAATGVVLGAAYMLWLVRNVFWGPISAANKELPDLSAREWVVMVPMLSAMLILGLVPGPFLRILEGSVVPIVDIVIKAQAEMGN